jgi:type IV/VI secretion system ImpK/VasF family protein
MYRASVELLLAATRIGEARSLPAPDVLRGEILEALRVLVSRCRALGVPDTETVEARYAIVAFIDERVSHSNWPGRTEWMNNPLQLQLYREYTAGENFFARMRVLLHRGVPSQALEVYYLCLALGFTGALPGNEGAQASRSYLEAAREPLTRSARGLPASPRAIPSDRYPPQSFARSAALPLALTCAAVGLLGLCAMGWSIHRTLDRVGQHVAAVDAAPVISLEH